MVSVEKKAGDKFTCKNSRLRTGGQL